MRSLEYQCELCGRALPVPGTPVRIEGSILNVCFDCEKYGIPVERSKGVSSGKKPAFVSQSTRQSPRRSSSRPRRTRSGRPEKILVEDYGDRIREARQKKGWSHQTLSRRIREAVTMLQNIETGKLRPSDEVVKKLERELGISLMEEVTDFENVPKVGSSGPKSTTLGDIIIIKDKKKKKKD